MSWEYRKVLCNPVAFERLKTRGSNDIIAHLHNMVYPNIEQFLCAICCIPYACPSCVAQLDI